MIRSPSWTSPVMPDDAGDGRDAPAPGQDRRVAGAAAGLGDDARRSAGCPGSSPGSGRISCATRITGSSPFAGTRRPASAASAGCSGQVRADPRDHVADVGHPLAEVLLLDPGEAGGVALEDRPEGREGGQAAASRSGRGPWPAAPGR